MNILNSIGRGFGNQIGRNAANKVTSGTINTLWSICWKFVKWCMIITFLFGVLQGVVEALNK